MSAGPRSRAQRRRDTEQRLTHDIDAWVAARFLPVGLSVGVAISSVSPSQSKDSGTRYGAPSADALATQTSTSWLSRCSVSRRR